jgi:hypothetical protein
MLPHPGKENAGAGSNLAQLIRIEKMQLVERLHLYRQAFKDQKQ